MRTLETRMTRKETKDTKGESRRFRVLSRVSCFIGLSQFSEFSAQPFEAFLAATLIYMGVTWCVVLFMRGVEARLRIPGMAAG